MSYYDILDIPHNSTIEDVKKAYRKLALIHHPDKGGNAEKFKQIQEAYTSLTNKPSFINPHIKLSIFDLQIDITLEELYHEIEKDIVFNRPIICEYCNGFGSENVKICDTCQGQGMNIQEFKNGHMSFRHVISCNTCHQLGYITGSTICSVCSGKKAILKNEQLKIKINKSLDIIIHENLRIKFNVKPHPIYTQNGINLRIDKQITLKEALHGFSFTIDCISGEKLTIVSNDIIQPNSFKIIKDKGMKSTNGYGDLEIFFSIKLTEDDKANYIV